MWKADPVAGDVNKDGHMDLVAHPRLGEGVRRKNVILLAGPGSRIAGVVNDPEGRPVGGATVFARAPLGLSYERTAAPDGTFEFAGLPAGEDPGPGPAFL